MMSRRLNPGVAVMVMTGLVLAAASGQTLSQGVVRDTPAQQRDKPAAASGRIAGRVLGADNGRPVTRALVRLTAPELPGGRSALTDNSGAFEFIEPASRPLHPHRVQGRLRRAVVRPASAAPGRHAAPAGAMVRS